jgi:phage terminase large subunit
MDTAVDAGILADPVGFTAGILGHDVWRIPAQILESLAKNRHTAVKSCHASGKTFTAAEAVIWWVSRYRDGIAITTAPTWLQVKKLLWGEIRKTLPTARIEYPTLTPSATELKLGEGNYALGLSTNEGVNFQGFHSPHILIVLDEAPGVEGGIWEAIAGVEAGGEVHVLAIGNPVIASGPFYDAFHTNRERWSTFTISAFDTPNLAGISLTYTDRDGRRVTLGNGRDLLLLSEEELDQAVRPYLTTRRWVRDKFYEWGPGHPLWDSRVLGNFPSQAEDALIPLAWLEKCQQSDSTVGVSLSLDSKKLRAGLDVAGPGEDETVLVVRDGPWIIFTKVWMQADPRGEVVAALKQFAGRLEVINVDSAGIGWNMYTHLNDIFPGIAHPINVGESPHDSEKYANLKAELYWGLRMRAQAGDLIGYLDEKLVGQLAGIRYKHNARGQIVIESKEEARKRGRVPKWRNHFR